jgi:hypothetical protein
MMDLCDFYPSPTKLIESEISVLDYLRSNPYIKEKQPQVATDAEKYFPRNKGSHSGFNFNSHFDICHAPMVWKNDAAGNGGKTKPNARLTLSVLINVQRTTFTNVTYCLSVCRMRAANPRAQLTILRKFHFDVAVHSAPTSPQLQQHPRCHLQYCGEMVPYMTTVGCRSTQLDQMHPWLSEPRIFFWPMSLGLLIDMALHEFPDSDSAKFRSDSYWRGLVRKQEALVLRPFYEKCVEVIKNNKGANQTLADAFYIS